MAAVLSSSPPPATSDAERRRGAGVIQLPAPFATDVEKRTTDSDAEAAIFLGSSTVFLPSLRLRPPVPPKDDTEPPPSVGIPVRAEASCQFELEYMALRKGFSVLGGLRVFVTRDAEVNGSDDGSDDDDDRTLAQSVALVDEAKLLKEWDTAGEIWVKPAGLN